MSWEIINQYLNTEVYKDIRRQFVFYNNRFPTETEKENIQDDVFELFKRCRNSGQFGDTSSCYDYGKERIVFAFGYRLDKRDILTIFLDHNILKVNKNGLREVVINYGLWGRSTPFEE